MKNSLVLILLVSLIFGFSSSADAKKKSKSPHKVGFSAQAGGGYDTNVFNKKTPQDGALLQQASAKVKYSFKASKKLTWLNSFKLANSYRSGDAAIEALKLNVGVKSGVKWQVFGKSKNKPKGYLTFNLSYGGSFNPTLNNPDPAEDEDVIDDEDETDDNLGDDFFDDEVAMDDAGEDGFDTDEDESEAEDEDGEDEFEDAEDLGTKIFNSKPSRHTYNGDVGLKVVFNKTTELAYTTKGVMGEIEETPGRVSSDFWQFNNSLNFKKKLLKKRLTLKTGYGLGMRFFTDKTTPSGDALTVYSHAFSLLAKIKPIKKFTLDTGYRLGYSQVPGNTRANTLFHQALLVFEYKILKQLSVFEANHFTYAGKTLTSIYAPRFQMMLGLKTQF